MQPNSKNAAFKQICTKSCDSDSPEGLKKTDDFLSTDALNKISQEYQNNLHALLTKEEIINTMQPVQDFPPTFIKNLRTYKPSLYECNLTTKIHILPDSCSTTV